MHNISYVLKWSTESSYIDRAHGENADLFLCVWRQRVPPPSQVFECPFTTSNHAKAPPPTLHSVQIIEEKGRKKVTGEIKAPLVGGRVLFLFVLFLHWPSLTSEFFPFCVSSASAAQLKMCG